MSGDGINRNTAALAALETSVEQARRRRLALAEEREALTRSSVHGLPREDPHAHLRHRALPNVDPARTRRRVLRVWSAVSASFLLAGLAVAILGHLGELLPAVGGLAVVMLCAEAFARGHLVQFVAGLLAADRRRRSGMAGCLGGPGPLADGCGRRAHPGRRRLLFASIRDFFIKR